MSVRISCLFNSDSILCPTCKISNFTTSRNMINTPEEAWDHPFICKNCNRNYSLGQIAQIQNPFILKCFSSWFELEFPGQSKPWETCSQTPTPTTLSPEDFEAKF